MLTLSWHRSKACVGLFALALLAWSSAAMASPANAADVTASDEGESEPAAPRVLVRFAIHQDYDRLVLKLPPLVTATYRQEGATLKVQFGRSGGLTGTAVVGRRILSMTRGQSEATLQLAPDARVRTWRTDDLLVVDVFDPHASPTKPPSTTHGGVTLPNLSPSPRLDVSHVVIAAPMKAASTRPSAAAPALATVPVTNAAVAPASSTKLAGSARSIQPTVMPDGISSELPPKRMAEAFGAGRPVSIMVLRQPGTGPAFLVPFGRDVGAAAFARGNEARVVFDSPQSFDLSGLKDDANFSSVTEQLLPDGMQLRLRLPSGSGLGLARRDDGWVVSLQHSGPAAPLSPIIGRNRNGVTVFDANAAGHVVVVTDELTGGRLLVGTQRIEGQHVGSAHLSAEAVVLPTWQGVVVQPASDRVLLRARQAGFELSSIDAPLAMTWSDQQTGAWPDGRTMTRLFEFSDAPPEGLHRLLGQALRDAAATPKPARLGPRLGVAQAMLAQGLDVEASAVLRTAEADDPAGHDRHCARCLAALAAWLSARAGGQDSPDVSIDEAAFGDSDEAALLKALLRPVRTDLAGQAAAVASTWPLLLGYPPALRRFMLEPVADLLLKGGQQKALAAFLAAFPDASLDLARADFLQSRGKIDESLKLYDQVARGRDRLSRAKALERAVLAKLAFGRMSPASAAEALNRQLYAWRGGDREFRIREHVAKLRAEAGEWRSALTMLTQTEEQFPQSHTEIRAAKSALVTDLLKGDNLAKLSAIDLVAIADSLSDVLDGNDASFAPALIDKLLALDLAARADPILRRLFQNAKDASTKAELGARLADSMLDGGDPAAALAVLAASDDPDLGAAIVSRRTLLRARLLAQSGKQAGALEVLSGLHTPEASKLAATIMEGQHDWMQAAETLKPLLSDAGFAAMPPADQRDLVLRLARDEAEAGDQAGLHFLHQTQAAHFQTGPNATLFAVLTAEPVRSTADLPRSATEVRALQTLPASIAKGQPF